VTLLSGAVLPNLALRLIVTRPADQAQPWVLQLQQQGLDAVALPLIRISALANTQPLRDAAARLAQYRLVNFVSANAVQHFFAAQAAFAWPAQTLAGSTGPGTTAALLAAGVPASAVVAPAADAATFDSEALWQQLRHHTWAGQQVLLVRGEEGRDWLATTLRAQGASVQLLPAYLRSAPVIDGTTRPLLLAALQQPKQHVWLLSSSEAVGHLVQLLVQLLPGLAREHGAHLQPLKNAQAWAGHPRIAQTARDAGFGQVLLVRPELAAVVQQARHAQVVMAKAALLQSPPL
jgi:uroporphyrinogen-III synthase